MHRKKQNLISWNSSRATALRSAAAVLFRAACVGAVFSLTSGAASAQTYGFATLQPGALSYSMGSAVAKVFKEKAGINILVQPQGGDNVLVPMVGRGEIELGIATASELHAQVAEGKLSDLRLIGTINPLRLGAWVRKDSTIKTIADLKGKRVVLGFSAMRVFGDFTRATLATGGLTEKDVIAVLAPNVNRGAEEFIAGSADMFVHAYAAPKVREADATVGGIRQLEIDPKGMAAARKVSAWGYLSHVSPGSAHVGVLAPTTVLTVDNMLFTSAKVSPEFIYKVIETMEKNRDEMAKISPVLGEIPAADAYRQYGIPYHQGALNYYKAHNIQVKPLPQ